MIGKYVPPLDSLRNMGSIAAGAHASLSIPGAAHAIRAADTTEGGCRKTAVSACEGCSTSVRVTTETTAPHVFEHCQLVSRCNLRVELGRAELSGG